ncbi:MAG: hypothetical protein LH618_03950, partial [Saprospiraceae bacterium]|nr:hypothetical protein [Saprospiraceae bacterium]
EYTWGTDRTLTEHYDFFEETLGTYLGDDTAFFLKEYVDNGKRIPLSAYIMPDFLTMKASATGAPVVGIVVGGEAGFRK